MSIRTIVRVLRVEVGMQDRQSELLVIVPSWDLKHQVKVDPSDLPERAMLTEMRPGTLMFACCNTDAEEHEPLRFDQWEFAPEPMTEEEVLDLYNG
jgi:hypothetical protein